MNIDVENGTLILIIDWIDIYSIVQLLKLRWSFQRCRDPTPRVQFQSIGTAIGCTGQEPEQE